MAIERKWLEVPPKAFVADGSNFGLITLVDTAGFRVKMAAYLTSNSQPELPVQIKRVLSPTQLIVGTINSAQIGQWPPLNISAYTVADNAKIGAQLQDKSNIKPDDIEVATYEADPVVARRVVLVDQYGNIYSDTNPLPATFTGTISIGSVEIVGPTGNILNPNADGSLDTLVKGPSGNYLDPNSDGSENVINLGQLVPFKFDEIDLTNTVIGGQTVPTIVVYKQSSLVVATLTLTYDGSANVTSVVRS